jgi:co-chaperonin GroES (HSP10)
LKQGPLCYKDESKFPTGPWCKEGDFVLLRAYSGSRFSCDGKEFIIVNDDMIEGTVEDPRGLGRAY